MLDLLSRAKNAIEAYNTQLRINSSNIANMSVPGYKSLKISFQTIYEQMLHGGSAAIGDVGGTNPFQLGASVGIAGTSIDFSQGGFTEGGALDLGINGSGLFIVSDDGGDTFKYTRAGHFQIDSNGNLITANGMQVYGLSSGALTPITGLSAYNTSKLSWTSDGELAEITETTNTDGTTTRTPTLSTGYKIALTSFNNLAGLSQGSGNTFVETVASGASLTPDVPGSSYGSISTKSTEQSNVFYTGEIIDSLEAQRAMSGNLTMVKTINDSITNFITRIS
jgi:flagellar hook protein FlgE